MDDLDRKIINHMQGGFPLRERPYQWIADTLDTTEDELIQRLQRMINDGRLSRFGPLYNIERMGGKFVLCAMHVPERDFDEVAAIVNALPEVAHNYQRQHNLNMWFVLAAESAEQIDSLVDAIQRKTTIKVYQFPKLDEYFIGLRFSV